LKDEKRGIRFVDVVLDTLFKRMTSWRILYVLVCIECPTDQAAEIVQDRFVPGTSLIRDFLMISESIAETLGRDQS
jgi:hypothetical protein